MKISKLGITLSRLTYDDIELLREKRNLFPIRKKMFYQKKISKEEQKIWFKSINNHLNYYFIISNNESKVGLIHGKIISFEKGIAEGGIFLWEDGEGYEFISVKASLIMAELTFNLLGLNETQAKVRTDNPKAIAYNKLLGYNILYQNEVETSMTLSKEGYHASSNKIKKGLSSLIDFEFDLSWKDICINQWVPEWYDKLPLTLKNIILTQIESNSV